MRSLAQSFLADLDNTSDSSDNEIDVKFVVGDIKDSSPLQKKNLSYPLHFLCPLTKSVFKDPVVATDGCTYERSAIIKFFQDSPSFPPLSPVTGNKMSLTIVSNWTLKSEIQNFQLAGVDHRQPIA
jgi:hypothetical protein